MSQPNAVNIARATASILDLIHLSSNAFYDEMYLGIDADDAAGRINYYIEKAFVELVLLLEAIGLERMHSVVVEEQAAAKVAGFDKSAKGPDEPYLVWTSRIRIYVDAIRAVFGLKDEGSTEATGLDAILRRAEYSICDKNAFGGAPANEADVHDRLEAILRCYYPDLKRKPALTKPIKNFEPDSGIPSIRTLIEYKFVTNQLDGKRVVDEILTDASAYSSSEWRKIVYVVYETNRVFSEKEWESLLAECRLDESCRTIVLRGESKPASKPKGPARSSSNSSKAARRTVSRG